MSDARAKAEARRAKILARESSMKVTAIGDDLSLPVEGKPQERPLAKRRSLVKAISEKSMEAESSTPTKANPADEDDATTVTEDTPIKGGEVKAVQQESPAVAPSSSAKKESKKNVDDDPEVESIEQHSSKQEDNAATKPKSEEEKKELLKKLSPKKSLKEIEEEVARNTAKYDEETLKGEKPAGKRAKMTKEEAMKTKASGASSINNINPTNITRLFRMFIIIFLGVYKGYYAALSNMNSRDKAMIMAMEGASMQSTSQPVQAMTFDEFGDPIVDDSVSQQQQQQQQQSAKRTRTWGEWVQYKMTAPFESTVTAVGLSYWFANMLSAGINSRLKSAPKPKSMLEQAMALYQSGFEGLLERVFCLFGEYALHLGTILLVTTLLSLYMEDAAASSLASAAMDAVQQAVTSSSKAEL